jgi:hypothetical protein
MRRLPVRAQSLVAVVAIGGLVSLLVRLPDLTNWGGSDMVAFLILSAGIVLAEQFQVPLRYGNETLNFSLTEALWVGALVLARPSVVTIAVATGVVLGQAMRRVARYKLAFNAGQFLLALTAAQVVVEAVRSPGVLEPMTFVAVGLGMTVYTAMNAGLVALVISQAQGKPFQSVLIPPLPKNILHFAANTALGLVAVVMWQAAPGAVPVLVLPLAMCFLAYRALIHGLGESDLVRQPVAQHTS